MGMLSPIHCSILFYSYTLYWLCLVPDSYPFDSPLYYSVHVDRENLHNHRVGSLEILALPAVKSGTIVSELNPLKFLKNQVEWSDGHSCYRNLRSNMFDVKP
ncbi:hypothetical protein Peur_011665 [Populus x canadensis]